MTHNFKVSCLKDNLKQIRNFVNSTLDKVTDLSEIEINQLVLAVDEICSNLIIHGHKCNPEECIEIKIYTEKNNIIFEVLDINTNKFDINLYRKPSLSNIIKEKRKGGIGLLLVNRIMDDIQVFTNEEENIWQLSKKIES